MPFETTRDKHSAEIRERILAATDSFISKYGVNALTVKNLCELAGVSNGTFFHYYESKDALVAAYMQYGYDQYTKENPFDEDSCDFFKNIVEIHMHNIRYAKSLGVEFTRCYYNINNPNLHNRGNMDGEEYSRYLICQLNSAKMAGYVKKGVDTELVGADICMVAKGVIFEWGLCGDSFDVEAYLFKMLKLYLASVASSKYLKTFPQTLKG